MLINYVDRTQRANHYTTSSTRHHDKCLINDRPIFHAFKFQAAGYHFRLARTKFYTVLWQKRMKYEHDFAQSDREGRELNAQTPNHYTTTKPHNIVNCKSQPKNVAVTCINTQTEKAAKNFNLSSPFLQSAKFTSCLNSDVIMFLSTYVCSSVSKIFGTITANTDTGISFSRWSIKTKRLLYFTRRWELNSLT